MKKMIKIIALIVFISNIVSCSHDSQSKHESIVTVEESSSVHHLFYSGLIKPLKTRVIPSPVDGVIVETPFQYGQSIKAGQLLFMMSSVKFFGDYKASLMQYIKAKSEMNNAQTQLNEAQFLHKNQLISDDDFKMKQSSYYAARLALLQAKDSLENLLQQLDIKNINLFSLNIADIDKINQAIHLQMNADNLRIISPIDGIILSSNKNEDENKKIRKGDVVKQGDVLATIGDMNGLKVKIKVNELTVNQLAIGQKVRVTGIAFPDDILEGEIIRVDRQGDVSSGGLPTFNVDVCVNKLNDKQKKYIHVGMSAKVDITIDEGAQIKVPITALKEKNGESQIQLYDEKEGKKREVVVKTGKTTLDSIIVLAGLKQGDKIVIPN